MTEFEPKIYRAAMANPVKMEQLTGQKIHPAYYDIEPQGCRLHVVVEEVPEKSGNIWLTDTGEKMGCGYVMAVGAFAGETIPQGPAPIGMVIVKSPEAKISDPEDLLYAHVIIGKIRGMPITVSFDTDKEYPAEVVVIDEREVKSVDFNPVPLKVRAEGGE